MMTILDTIKRKRSQKNSAPHDHDDYFYTESEGIIARWAATEEGQRVTQRMIELSQATSLTLQESTEAFALNWKMVGINITAEIQPILSGIISTIEAIAALLPPDEKQVAHDRSRADLQTKRKQYRSGKNRHIR